MEAAVVAQKVKLTLGTPAPLMSGARSQEHLDFLCGYQEPKYLCHNLLPTRHISRKPNWKQRQDLSTSTLCLCPQVML